MLRLKRSESSQYKDSKFPKIEKDILMDPQKLQKYKAIFTNLEQVENELEAVRECLVQCEHPNFYKNVSLEEHKKAVAKFTQLFKALLEVKQNFEKFKGF